MIMLLRRGRDVTLAKLVCSAFMCKERARFEEVDTGETYTCKQSCRHWQMHMKYNHKYCEVGTIKICAYVYAHSEYICIHI